MKSGRLISSLPLGLLVGILGAICALLPLTKGWEENIGLDLLFKIRGARPPPAEVLIISINGKTAEQLGLGEEIPEWPRSLHARLIDLLHATGVAVIAYDIFFKKARDPATDQQMADAMRRAKKVILTAYLKQQEIDSGGNRLVLEQLVHPAEILSEAASGLAPFVLPKVPVKVSRFWTFSGDNELISLPAVALQQLADPDGELLEGLITTVGEEAVNPGNERSWEGNYARLRTDAALRTKLLQLLEQGMLPHLSSQQRSHLTSLIRLYGYDAYPYLNFYGPPGSIATVPIQVVLEAPPAGLSWLEGKVVFVGYAGDYQPRQKDGFYTTFSQPDGLDLSGVEIAATAFANLLRGETLSPLTTSEQLILLLCYGLVITLIFRSLPGIPGVLCGIATSGVYFYLTYTLFAVQNIWLPWFVPLVLQTPLALILIQIWHYRLMRISRAQLRELFGYYLPGEVIDQLAQNNQHPLSQGHSAFGVCLASDAQSYTQMAETLEPEALQTYLNRYYEILFTPVRARGGVVSDVVGDAMLAIWPTTRQDDSLKRKACEAALEINHALETADLEPRLHTRIGLHAGALVMTHVGAIDHFEYRAVGDMVNTTSRIENLNKLLGTSILASADFVAGLQGILTRELGRFPVSGRQQPITLYEIAATADSSSAELRILHSRFADALSDWQADRKQDAYRKFKSILDDFPQDGPSNYYFNQYHERRSSRINPLG